MAATLLIGIGLGRFAMRDDAASPGVAAAPVAIPAPTTGSPTAGGGSIDPAATVARSADRPAAEDGAPVPDGAGATRRPAPVRNVASGRTAGGELPATGSNGDAVGTAYAMASRDHLTRAEALVAVVATMPADAMMDSLMGRWARDVLMNTRLLLDSPAGEDPIRRRLLEDLETLLVQLVQRSGRAAEEAWERAASSFRSIVERYPKSAYAGDALYWEAFALQRVGGQGDLRRAATALERQRVEYPKAATFASGESAALLTRVNGRLARRGDSEAAAYVSEIAAAIADATVAGVGQAMSAAASELARVGPEVERGVAEAAREMAQGSARIARGSRVARAVGGATTSRPAVRTRWTTNASKR